MRLIAILVVSTFAACGGKTASVASLSNAPVAQGSAVELGEITIFDDAEPMLKIHADGSTEMANKSGRLYTVPGTTASSRSLTITWQAGPTIRPDGIVSADGRDVARINADGTVIILETSEPLPATITDDKLTVTRQDGSTRTLALGADGALVASHGNRPPTPQGRVVGADTAGKRRTVLSLIAMMLIGSSSSVTVTTETSDSAPAMP
jgi:hypothetical protein